LVREEMTWARWVGRCGLEKMNRRWGGLVGGAHSQAVVVLLRALGHEPVPRGRGRPAG
jgi:hypothetical protein